MPGSPLSRIIAFGRSIGPYDIGLPLKPRTRRNLAGLARTHAAHAGRPHGLSYGSGDTGRQHGPDTCGVFAND